MKSLGLRPNGPGTGRQPAGLGGLVLPAQELRVIVERISNQRAVRTERALINGQHTLEQRLRQGVFALITIKPGQIADAVGGIEVVRAVCFLPYGKRPFVQRLGLSIIVLRVVKRRQIVQVSGDIDVIGSDGLLIERKRLLKQRFGRAVIPQNAVILANGAQVLTYPRSLADWILPAR